MRKNASQITETIQDELEKQLFHLKNLYDTSRNLYAATDFKKVLKDLLLTTMGSFGIQRAFVFTLGDPEEIHNYFLTQGLRDEEKREAQDLGDRFLAQWDGEFCVTEPSPVKHETFRRMGFAILLPFQIDEEMTGLLSLGTKLSEDSFSPQDRELIETLGSNLALALRNARSLHKIRRLNKQLTEQNVHMETVMGELDRKVYHLKTLFDVSKKIFESVNLDEILRRFLLLTMGNFGSFRGFVLLGETPLSEVTHFESLGYKEDILVTRKDVLLEAMGGWIENGRSDNTDLSKLIGDESLRITFGLPFQVDDGCVGMLGLGPKLVGDEFGTDDKELLETLVNNLVPALGNARAFENIQRLNLDLQETNRQLKETLDDLRAALRKVEILEGVKSNLSKFVPTAVTRMIEKSPETDGLEATERDVSVLFLDIEGYTRISERLQPRELNRLIEKYFSVFMDAIYENNGDVNETAGDGLMVLFLGEDTTANARDAVRTALSIQEKTDSIRQDVEDMHESVVVNMGISSGPAYVGAVKFDSYTGSRWTYTSRGMTTNLAARICASAKSGQILTCKETAERVKEHYPCSSLGKFALKNISEEMEIFAVS